MFSRQNYDRLGYYRLEKNIGQGTFANVYIANHELTGMKIALKLVEKSKQSQIENRGRLEEEIRNLVAVQNHPYILKLYQAININDYFGFVTEYVSKGDLYSLIKEKGRYSESTARHYFNQIVCAVAYCHSRNICHRDLKLENIMIDESDNVRLIDFGFSTNSTENLTDYCGSPPYTAPEVLFGEMYNGKKADVWSLGILLFVLVVGSFPYPSQSIESQKEAMISRIINIPFFVSVECADLIRKILNIIASKRISLSGICTHKWFLETINRESRELLLAHGTGTETQTNENILAASQLQLKLNTEHENIVAILQSYRLWTPDQITDTFVNKNFLNPIYGNYLLINEMVARTTANLLSTFPTDSMPRRSSRGSITSGKSNLSYEETANNSNYPPSPIGNCLGFPVEPIHNKNSRGSITTGIANVNVNDESLSSSLAANNLAKLSLKDTNGNDRIPLSIFDNSTNESAAVKISELEHQTSINSEEKRDVFNEQQPGSAFSTCIPRNLSMRRHTLTTDESLLTTLAQYAKLQPLQPPHVNPHQNGLQANAVLFCNNSFNTLMNSNLAGQLLINPTIQVPDLNYIQRNGIDNSANNFSLPPQYASNTDELRKLCIGRLNPYAFGIPNLLNEADEYAMHTDEKDAPGSSKLPSKSSLSLKRNSMQLNDPGNSNSSNLLNPSQLSGGRFAKLPYQKSSIFPGSSKNAPVRRSSWAETYPIQLHANGSGVLLKHFGSNQMASNEFLHAKEEKRNSLTPQFGSIINEFDNLRKSLNSTSANKIIHNPTVSKIPFSVLAFEYPELVGGDKSFVDEETQQIKTDLFKHFIPMDLKPCFDSLRDYFMNMKCNGLPGFSNDGTDISLNIRVPHRFVDELLTQKYPFANWSLIIELQQLEGQPETKITYKVGKIEFDAHDKDCYKFMQKVILDAILEVFRK
uniref:Protein kinase domain-containing protein n=1 Tax=Rhabditophanes sp. KR3021 TaxID=114890 RepID=A0AC35U777_9BILA